MAEANLFPDFDFLGERAKRALMDLMGATQARLSRNDLNAWGRLLEGHDPEDIVTACRKALRQFTFWPKWSEFEPLIPTKLGSGDVFVDLSRAFWWSPGGDGEFGGNIEAVPRATREEWGRFILEHPWGPAYDGEPRQLTAAQRRSLDTIAPWLMVEPVAPTLPMEEAAS